MVEHRSRQPEVVGSSPTNIRGECSSMVEHRTVPRLGFNSRQYSSSPHHRGTNYGRPSGERRDYNKSLVGMEYTSSSRDRLRTSGLIPFGSDQSQVSSYVKGRNCLYSVSFALDIVGSIPARSIKSSFRRPSNDGFFCPKWTHLRLNGHLKKTDSISRYSSVG